MKDTKAILSIAYKECESKIKSNMNGFKKYMSNFMSYRTRQFYSNAPYEMIYFTHTDIEEFFNSTKIDKNIITDAISKTYYATIGNFNPRYAKDECTMAILCLVRHFLLNKMKKELDLALILLSFSGKLYPSIWHGSFPITPPQENIMDYVINYKASNKFDIVSKGNVVNAVKSVSDTWVESYPDKFKKFTDEDCVYLIQQLHNRIRSFMNNIAELYYEAYKNKEYLTYDSDNVSEDNYRLADNDSLKLERYTDKAMTRITAKGVDFRICKMSSSSRVKMNELKSIIENIITNNKNMDILREYIGLSIALYFREPNSSKDVTDLAFVSFCIKPKPNTKDKYLLRHKECLDLLLVNNSEHFLRRKNNDATRSAYYRAMNAYFAITIQEANK